MLTTEIDGSRWWNGNW